MPRPAPPRGALLLLGLLGLGGAAWIALRPSPEPVGPIAIRTVNGDAEFYDVGTGERFVPRGANYLRLAPMTPGDPNLWQSTLSPGHYDAPRAEAALQEMRAAGFNVVRVSVDCCRPERNAGDPAGGVSAAYVANAVDFLRRAQQHHLFVLMVLELTPADGGYNDSWAELCCVSFDRENLRYLPPGGDDGERRFNHDFIEALIAEGAPLDAIFAYDLNNEVFFDASAPPLNQADGLVTTANGLTYDMARPGDKQRMMDDNLVAWIDRQREGIREVHADALVTVSFFAPSGLTPPWRQSGWQTRAQPALTRSTADFVDLHAYPGFDVPFDQYAADFEITGREAKPTIIGEFGASRHAYPNAELAAEAMARWQAASCDFGFDGWLLWTWDTEERTDLWSAVSDEGRIARALSPAFRTDPCDV
jgi:hypothetical protein